MRKHLLVGGGGRRRRTTKLLLSPHCWMAPLIPSTSSRAKSSIPNCFCKEQLCHWVARQKRRDMTLSGWLAWYFALLLGSSLNRRIMSAALSSSTQQLRPFHRTAAFLYSLCVPCPRRIPPSQSCWRDSDECKTG